MKIKIIQCEKEKLLIKIKIISLCEKTTENSMGLKCTLFVMIINSKINK